MRSLSRFGWVVVLVALLAAWELYVRARGIPDYLLPAPSDIARTLWDERSTLADQALVTLQEMVLGLVAAVAAGLAAAVVLHRSETLRRAVYPLLIASQSIPVVAVAPILVIYLGFGLTPKVLIVALVCFFPVTVATLDALRAVDPEHRRVMRTLNASPRRIFWHIEVPFALSGAFSGTRVAASYSAVAALFAEYAGGSGGLAESMRNGLDTPLVGAAVTLLALMSLGLFGLVTAAERLALPWAHRRR